MTLRSGFLLAVFAACAIACGDDNDSGPPSYVGETNSALVTKAAGGKIAVGAVSVEFPQNAVATDQTITVKVNSKKGRPKEQDIAIDVYEFGPEMQFAEPVKMTFDLKGVSTKQKRADVAYLQKDTNKWVPLADSQVDGGKITATTKHFSEYTVLLTPITGGGVGVGKACDTGFQACGGDLTGTWTFQTACSAVLDPGLPDGGVILPCKDPGRYESGLDVSGSVTFNADGTYTINRTSIASTKLTIPQSCLAEISQQLMQPYTCEMFIGTIENGVCVSIQGEDSPIVEDTPGRYTVEGTQLTTTDIDPSLIDAGIYGGDSGIDPYQRAQFCVSGDTLRVRYPDTATGAAYGFITEYSATRQQ